MRLPPQGSKPVAVVAARRAATIALAGALMAGHKAGAVGWVVLGILGLAYFSSRGTTPAPPAAKQAAPLGAVQPAPVAFSPMPTFPRTAAPLSAAPSLPAVPEPAPAWTAVMYTTARVNLRSAPSVDAQVLLRLEAGASVAVSGSEGRWWKAAFGGKQGWVHADYLTTTAPPPAAAPPREPPPKPTAPSASLVTPRAMGRKPIREAYTGICDCPYDYKRNGARCGATSAYSRPGGREPDCYE